MIVMMIVMEGIKLKNRNRMVERINLTITELSRQHIGSGGKRLVLTRSRIQKDEIFCNKRFNRAHVKKDIM